MKAFLILLFISLVVITGCIRPPIEEPPVPLETIEDTLAWAQENLDTLKELPIDAAYKGDYQKAFENLTLAETSFQEELYEQAYFAALESLETSQRIIQDFYQESVASSAHETKTRIQAITAEDPESPLQEFLPALDEILDYSEKLDTAQTDIDIAKILTDLKNVQEIGDNTRKTMKKTLESDVFFASGKYQISHEGQEILKTYCQDVLEEKNGFQRLYPDRRIAIKIHVTGYTDQVDFREGTNLLKQLKEEAKQEIPTTQPGLRKFLNQRLAELRAQNIADFIMQCVLQAEPDISIEQRSLGLGEELPPGLSSPFPLSDPRRRICKIYTYILVR